MITPRAALVLAAVLLAPLAGCERERPAAPAAPAAAPAPPLAWSEKTADAEAELTLPAALKTHPALHRRLFDEEVAAARKFVAEAKAERAAVGFDMPPYGLQVAWRVSAETPRLLSLVREVSSYTGGAHPNSGSTTLLWDKRAGRELDKSALFADAAARPRLEAELCDALKAAKAERGGVELTGDVWSCPRWNDLTLALSPGAGGRAGGVVALFSPYEVGPYAEGAYDVTLPATAVRAAVAPEFRAEFAG